MLSSAMIARRRPLSVSSDSKISFRNPLTVVIVAQGVVGDADVDAAAEVGIDADAEAGVSSMKVLGWREKSRICKAELVGGQSYLDRIMAVNSSGLTWLTMDIVPVLMGGSDEVDGNDPPVADMIAALVDGASEWRDARDSRRSRSLFAASDGASWTSVMDVRDSVALKCVPPAISDATCELLLASLLPCRLSGSSSTSPRAVSSSSTASARAAPACWVALRPFRPVQVDVEAAVEPYILA